MGGILFIDEAYALGNSEKTDSFSKECIYTLCEALSVYKDNLMVISAGYENELKECFFIIIKVLIPDLHGTLTQKKVNDIGWTIAEDSKPKIKVDLFKNDIF